MSEQAQQITTITPRPSDHERRATLDSALQRAGAEGWRIENRSEFQATIAEGKQTNHVLHLLLCVVTVGIWIPVWIVLSIFGGVHRKLLSVDGFGNVVAQKI